MSPDDLRSKLQTSDLFLPDLPKRVSYTHAEWASVADETRDEEAQRTSEARRRVKSWPALCDAIEALGQAKHEPAVPLLCQLWSECALTTVRDAAGEALAAIGTPEARSALSFMLDDMASSGAAARAIVATDVRAAFDRFVPYFTPDRLRQPGGHAVPLAVLDAFVPSAFGPSDAVEPWVELFVRVRHHPALADAVQVALKRADPALVRSAIDAARTPRTAASGDRWTRYLRGEHGAVWEELREHEAIDGDLRDEALAVARETMRRVASNADRVAERLAERGWKALFGALRTAPKRGDKTILATLAETTGAPLPPSLLAFWELVGGIDFIWNYKRSKGPVSLGVALKMDAMDPLAIFAPKTVKAQLESWPAAGDPEHDASVLLELAPDSLHKADVSGGPAYGIALPFWGADPILANEAHALPFTDYLRLCFRWGCFPLLARHAEREDVQSFVAEIGRDLEPF